jgi:N-glycosylase/DNA lyase
LSQNVLTEQLLRVAAPPSFSFWMTVNSHGWYSLPPFSIDANRHELRRVIELPDGDAVNCTVSCSGPEIRIRCVTEKRLLRADQEKVRAQVRTMLRLEEDFDPFHRETEKLPGFGWIARAGAGRLLRAPTVFEDLVKMICTTNCTWSLTTLIVNNLVGSLGPRSTRGWLSFPNAERLAGSTERFLRKEIKAGYRSPYLLELAERVAAGKLNPERWRFHSGPTSDLMRELLQIKGVGPYAAQNMLKLLGRYDFLALDSWVRSKYFSMYHQGRKVKDRTIESRYSRYGKWRGLVFWLEMTRDWHEEKFPVQRGSNG